MGVIYHEGVHAEFCSIIHMSVVPPPAKRMKKDSSDEDLDITL